MIDWLLVGFVAGAIARDFYPGQYSAIRAGLRALRDRLRG